MVIEMNEKLISHGIETKILAQIRNLLRQKAKTGKEKEKTPQKQQQKQQEQIKVKTGECW